ncbi:hypothetical protein ACIQPP_34715, partial [Streptomyces violaceusniger]|uniref:hypothetical protein n=1 Tax=Streptomyces violaceusniger TaxID=68280 RepID=UPI00380F0627
MGQDQGAKGARALQIRTGKRLVDLFLKADIRKQALRPGKVAHRPGGVVEQIAEHQQRLPAAAEPIEDAPEDVQR